MFADLLSTLFQPNKGHLSPAGRAFVSWLEIVILGIIASGATVGVDYLNGHPNDYKGAIDIMITAVVIALLKALSGLSVPRITPQTPLPTAQALPALLAQQQQGVSQQPQPVEHTATTTLPQPSGDGPQLEFAPLIPLQQMGQHQAPPPIPQQESGTYPWPAIGADMPPRG